MRHDARGEVRLHLRQRGHIGLHHRAHEGGEGVDVLVVGRTVVVERLLRQLVALLLRERLIVEYHQALVDRTRCRGERTSAA